MAESPSPSVVGTNPQDGDGIDAGAATLIDLIWPLDSGQSVTAETAWQAVHTALRSLGVAAEEGWTERAVAKGLEIALAARAVAQGGQEPTITSVKAFLTTQNGTTGDYRKFSAIVAKAKTRFLQDRKSEPLYVPPHEPAKASGSHGQRESKQAEQVEEQQGMEGVAPAHGLISFDLSEKMAAAQLQRFTREKDTALQDLRNANDIASSALQSTIATLANQLTIEQHRSARSQRMTMALTIITIVVCVLALGTVTLFLSQRQLVTGPTPSVPTLAPNPVPAPTIVTPTAVEPPVPAHVPKDMPATAGGGKAVDAPVDPLHAGTPPAPQPDTMPKP